MYISGVAYRYYLRERKRIAIQLDGIKHTMRVRNDCQVVQPQL